MINDLSSIWCSNKPFQHAQEPSERDRLVDMLAFSGHEMNNTLTRMALSIESLLREGDAGLTERQKIAIQSLIENARQLRNIAKTYPVLAQLEDGDFEEKLELIDPAAEIIDPVVSSYGEVLAGKHQSCLVNVSAPGRQVLADRTLLTSVVDNLLNNAIKYGLNNSQIRITVRETASTLEICCQNCVERINTDSLDHIFDRFVRGANANNQHGMGIGLYLVSRIVDRLDGTVWVETCELRNHVKFFVRLPIRMA